MKVIRLDAPQACEFKRVGFMAGQINVPDDFDQMGNSEIKQLFGAE